MTPAEQYVAARAAYYVARNNHRIAVVEHYQLGRMTRRDYLPIRDRCEEAARVMLRCRAEHVERSQLSLALGDPRSAA